MNRKQTIIQQITSLLSNGNEYVKVSIPLTIPYNERTYRHFVTCHYITVIDELDKSGVVKHKLYMVHDSKRKKLCSALPLQSLKVLLVHVKKQLNN